jgi:hypothetical protein
MGSPQVIRTPHEARAETVENLVLLARRGGLRVPVFQRPLRWDTDDVLQLLDSIYRGLPIGTLLFHKRDADAARIGLGPLVVDAERTPSAWWVVDGQQRVTSLAATLLRPLPFPREADPFVVYFDPDAEKIKFLSPPRKAEVPSTWIPLPLLFDATDLGEWLADWPAKTSARSRSAYEAGKRIREYRVPFYVIDTDDHEVLREVFFRVNKAGKGLEWAEIHDALYGHDGSHPSSIPELAGELATLGMGRMDEADIASCLVALRGLDVTRTLAEHHRRDPEALRGAAAEGLPVLRQVLGFLRAHAGVVHLRLLPRNLVLPVLTRFFAKHVDPNPRSRELLARWVWRALLHTELDHRTLQRRGVAAVSEDEEGSVQALLSRLPRERLNVTTPDEFDPRAAASRFSMLALASLGPRDLDSGEPLDVAALIEQGDADSFRLILPADTGSPALRSAANRILLPGTGSKRRAILRRVQSPPTLFGPRTAGGADPVLASHAIPAEAVAALEIDRIDEFLEARKRCVTEALQALADKLAGWSRSDRDRPSIAYLLRDTDEDGAVP